ncbi:hypothetical protein [Sphingomonas lenta]|uniref:DNA binding HTH domain-containing protein n=1 Tax=Sphingomonas lenta TaxID=1141887 RepID=A0A2A2SDK6_9SPHN|nr:hypothetical protein [Sphingomonas lenta]PAX07337.1 hypothetical protein CKY28_15085 [Sphingomonas lenta]
MPRRTCPRTQALENQSFLRALRETGNAREAARAVGLSRTRFTKRRAADPAFAAEWDAALVLAQAGLKGLRMAAAASPSALRPTPVRVGGQGKVQLRRPAANAKLTRDHEQRFLLALSASANVRLASAAAGLSHATFYARKRRSRAFAREWRAALEQGYARVEMAAVAAADPDSYRDDAWSHNHPPELPPMTAAQALQLLYLHQKEVRLAHEPAAVKRRRGEPDEVYWERVHAIREARADAAREDFRRAEAMRQVHGEGSPYHRWVVMPDLSQVGGWSKADPDKPAHDPGRALFGGWRIRDWEEGQ